MGSFSSRRVDGLKRRRDVAGLIELLQSGGEQDRRAAANVLVTIPDPRAVDPLVVALGADDWLLRLNAAIALGEYRESRFDGDIRRIVDPLTGALQDQQPSVRAAAASSLGQLRDSAAVGPLIATLDDDIPAVGKTAALVLRGFDDERARTALAGR